MKRFIVFTLFIIPLLGNERSVLFESFSERPKSKGSDKSVPMAVAMSLAIPGAGEMYMGSRNGFVFLGVESLLWLSYAGFSMESTIKHDDMISYGSRFAGIRPTGKNKKFFEDASRFSSRDEYNWYTSLVSSSFDGTYPETVDYYWKWQSNDQMIHFNDLRSQKEKAKRNATIVLAVMGINRVVSVIDVIRIGTYRVPDRKSSFSWDIHALPDGDDITLYVSLSKSF